MYSTADKNNTAVDIEASTMISWPFFIRCPFPHFETKPSPKQQTIAGLWYTYPPETYESQLGSLFPYIMEK